MATTDAVYKSSTQVSHKITDMADQCTVECLLSGNFIDLQSYQQWLDALLESQSISAEEVEILQLAQAATRKIIMVDDFTPQALAKIKRSNRKVA